ncbi:bifunctional phosphoribosylaminoimidazolecarboxamide formyltransferase/IMP cyclohydrolase [bacterium]|nr:bifunctional phosphoribosylaminoimidazolecarboxamide formyltransferase/IMP cyclohydrolase [bacterium]
MKEAALSEIKRALISVSDKTGIVPFAKELSELGVEIISTGGTAKLLSEKGVPVIPIDSVTGFPEMMDGRVKTLHPKIHGGLLGLRDNPDHAAKAKEMGIDWIDLVVVNLYPFEQTIAKPDVSLEDAVENIDIGGPTMLRSAAKNFRFVAVVTDPADYARILNEIRENGSVSEQTRQLLAAKVFRRTADYDSAIDQYLSETLLDEPVIRMRYGHGHALRYGENSHQNAAFYLDGNSKESSVAHSEILHGKAMSFNNYVDADAAYEAVKDLSGIGVAVIKHTNPCGYAVGESAGEALERAWAGDPISAFGSVIASNTPVDLDFARFLKGKDIKHIGFVVEKGRLIPQEVPTKFIEVIIAPDYTPEALELLQKTKALRLLKTTPIQLKNREPKTYRKITGGILEMDRDFGVFDSFQIVTKKNFDAGKKNLAEFTYKACKHTKSNAIVLGREYRPGFFQVIGMGAGQPNRVDSLRKLAVTKALENLQIEYDALNVGINFETFQKQAFAGMVMASDAFFPFDDTVRAAAEYGIGYIVQPGGSKRDQDSIDACDELGMAMALTGMRHFRH